MRNRLRSDAGFSLIETMVALGILTTALLSLAGVFAMGLRHLASSTPNLLAREKAREAVESVHTARDTRLIRWVQINNVSDGGVFVDGPQPLRNPGPDGLVNTGDDLGIERMTAPGPDGLLGTPDDRQTELTNFSRQIEIDPLVDGNNAVNPTLRQLRVTITYAVGRETRRYVLTTFISAIS